MAIRALAPLIESEGITSAAFSQHIIRCAGAYCVGEGGFLLYDDMGVAAFGKLYNAANSFPKYMGICRHVAHSTTFLDEHG